MCNYESKRQQEMAILESEESDQLKEGTPHTDMFQGAYIGIVDKNGEKICEGDFLFDGEEAGVVRYLPEQSSFVVKGIKNGNPTGYYSFFAGNLKLEHTKRIGSKYTHKKLWDNGTLLNLDKYVRKYLMKEQDK